MRHGWVAYLPQLAWLDRAPRKNCQLRIRSIWNSVVVYRWLRRWCEGGLAACQMGVCGEGWRTVTKGMGFDVGGLACDGVIFKWFFERITIWRVRNTGRAAGIAI